MGNPLFEAHLTENEPFTPLPEHFSETLKECIKQCISYDKNDRPEAVTLFKTAANMVEERELFNVSLVTAASRTQSALPSSSMQARALAPVPVN